MATSTSVGVTRPTTHDPTVLFVIDRYGRREAGTEGQLLQLLRNLPEQGFAPYLVVLRNSPFTSDKPDLCCPLQTLGIGRVRSLATLWKLVQFTRWLRREQIRLVHIYFDDASMIIPVFAWLAGAKVVVSRRDMGIWYSRLNLSVLRLVGRFVNRVIANSHAVARLAAEREWLRNDCIRVIYNGYDFDRSQAPAEAGLRVRLGIANTEPIVGIVANLRAVKRHADLIMAFTEVHRRHPNAHLVMVGDGPLRDALSRQVSETGLADRTHFLGSVSDVVPVVKHFTVGVLCSDSEGFSNALVEYMACGLSPVCTRSGGNVELVDDGENGFLVEVGDTEVLAERISQLLGDPMLSDRMGQAARQRARNHPLSRMLTETTQVYRELLSKEVTT